MFDPVGSPECPNDSDQGREARPAAVLEGGERRHRHVRRPGQLCLRSVTAQTELAELPADRGLPLLRRT